ncbi:hypothetical protein AD929_06460, partial [Gluconobacter potus]
AEQSRAEQRKHARGLTEEQEQNLVICIPSPGEDRPFSTMMLSSIPDLHILHGSQCFPMFLYEAEDDQ